MINSLTEEFTADRYQLDTTYGTEADSNIDEKIKKDIASWTSKDNVATYNGTAFKDGIGANKTQSAYIQFKLIQ